MNGGFLNINKPANCTSHDVVAMLRKSLGIKKIGHSGTLDPFATGVLTIGINDATRLFEYLPSDKVYLAEITFGIETNTDDITGKIINKTNNIPSIVDINKKLNQFIGKIKQRPPIFSAVKINGRKAYELARKNEIDTSDLIEKTIEIYSINVISCENNKFNLKIHCSSGTYVRAIARDLGKELNSLAVLSSLQRTKIGSYFTLEKSIAPESINKFNLENYLISPLTVIELPKVCLDSKQIFSIAHGNLVETRLIASLRANENVQILDSDNRLIAIGNLTNDFKIKPEKVFIKNGN